MKINREIKFRGKRVDKNEWIYGYLLKADYGLAIGEDLSKTSFLYVDEETIGQYTGLKDKNGKEIYEGDIVQYKPEEVAYTVMFDPTGYWCLDGNGARNSEMLIQLDDTNKYIEVVGNIYDESKDSDER